VCVIDLQEDDVYTCVCVCVCETHVCVVDLPEEEVYTCVRERERHMCVSLNCLRMKYIRVCVCDTRVCC
jgi:hypothetical protein